MQLQKTPFPDLTLALSDAGETLGILTDAGAEACSGAEPFLCGRRVLSTRGELRLRVGRMIMDKLALDYPKGYFVSVGERDIEVFLTEYCGAAALEEYLREKRLSAAREIERWREERLWDTNPVSSAGAAALNFTFDAASGTLGTDGGVNERRELETPSSVDGVRVRAIGRYGLAAYRRLQRLVLTDSLEEIPEYLIYGFMELRYVKISSHITVIPVGAFGRCKALKTVEIPEGVTEICRDAFFNDSSIERLTVPDSVTRVGGCAFVGVRRLSYGGSAPGYPWGASRVLGKLNY